MSTAAQGRYLLVFGRPENHVILHRADTLEEIRKRRQLSGDLVLEVCYRRITPAGLPGRRPSWLEEKARLEVCQSWAWLFDWECEQPNCYARRVQQYGWAW